MRDEDTPAAPAATSPFWQRPGDAGVQPVDPGQAPHSAPNVDSHHQAPNTAASAADEQWEALQQMGTQWLQQCSRAVHERPMAALGVAALAGFLVARMTDSR